MPGNKNSGRKAMMTTKQVAEYLGCSVQLVWNFTKKGKIKGYHVYGRNENKYRKEDVEQLKQTEFVQYE